MWEVRVPSAFGLVFFPTVADGGVIRATREKMIMGGLAGDGQRPGVFTVDTDRALEALRVTWGNAYVVCFDDAIEMGGARWQGWRIGGHGMPLAGATPDELNTAIRADWARWSQP